MKITVLTLFPNMFDGFLNESIIKRAREKGIVDIELVNFRDYTPLKNGQVDDSIYGGGPGMLLRCEPIFECLDAVRTQKSLVVMSHIAMWPLRRVRRENKDDRRCSTFYWRFHLDRWRSSCHGYYRCGDETFTGCYTRREFGFGGFRGWTTRLSFLY